MAYIVRQGDTMDRVARAMNVRLQELIAANPHLEDPDNIQIGDIVLMPGETMPASQALSDWCSFVLDIVGNRVPEPGVALVQFPVRRHVFVATMSMPPPSQFGNQFNIYTAWIADSVSPLRVKDFLDLSPTAAPGFWANHKNIPSLAPNDFIVVTPEVSGHGLQPTNPIPVLRGNLVRCCRG
ncbi:MAG: LysM peptidoglycan-binding domain-containing protein [Bacillota bacterium]